MLFNIARTKIAEIYVLGLRHCVKMLWVYHDNRCVNLKKNALVNSVVFAMYCFPSLNELTIKKLIVITYIHSWFMNFELCPLGNQGSNYSSSSFHKLIEMRILN